MLVMKKKLAAILMPVLLFVGCESASDQDLRDFIREKKTRPAGKIPEAPKFDPYKPYVYDSTRLRSPFDPPAAVVNTPIVASSNVKPDLDRQKQPLENFDFASLSMVGTVKKSGVLWGLIRDPNGSIERVRVGNYLGKNHGRITRLTEQALDVVEIVPNGLKGWLERPNIISLNGAQ